MSAEVSPSRKRRPVNLNLFTIRFPVTAVVSILHRLSGILLFFAVPALIWALDFSLSSPDNFAAVQLFMTHCWVKVLLWFFVTGLGYHLFAGLRHLVMDMGWGESLAVGRVTAFLVMFFSLLFSVLLGIYLW